MFAKAVARNTVLRSVNQGAPFYKIEKRALGSDEGKNQNKVE